MIRLNPLFRQALHASCVLPLLCLAAPANAQEAVAPEDAPAEPASPAPVAEPAELASPAVEPAPAPAPAQPVAAQPAAAPAEPAATSTEEAPVQDSTSALSPEQSLALWPLTWKKSPGQGVAFGLEEGSWGGTWSQGLRVTIPFTANFGTTLRGVTLMDMDEEGPVTVDAGGKIDLIGRSNVLFNIMRLYGGGGVQVIAPVANTEGKEVRVGAGGHFGFEFFCSPEYSFFLEVGGQGGTVAPGATVLAGMMFYPWTR